MRDGELKEIEQMIGVNGYDFCDKCGGNTTVEHGFHEIARKLLKELKAGDELLGRALKVLKLLQQNIEPESLLAEDIREHLEHKPQ